jgi:hypothetical protein
MTPTMLARPDLVQKLVLVAIPLGLLHHADHVGRADHSSWPFRPEVGPFTFTHRAAPADLRDLGEQSKHPCPAVQRGCRAYAQPV